MNAIRIKDNFITLIRPFIAPRPVKGYPDQVIALNEKYFRLSVRERILEIFHDFDPAKVLITSSFGTSSIFLLSLLQEVRHHTKIYFIDTGYLFRETLRYRDQLKELLNLDIITINPDPVEHSMTERAKTWQSDPDKCCNLNKIKPLKKIIPSFDVWMTGLTGYQNDYRKNLQIFENNDILRFYPLIDVTRHELGRYMESRKLPGHPLARKGFGSVGCMHCTLSGDGRSGRWANQNKTECGLHTKDKRQADNPF